MNALHQVSSPMVLVPAYGRTYTTGAALRADWEAGKDFRIYPDGPYTSIRDIETLKADASTVRIVDNVRPHIRITVA